MVATTLQSCHIPMEVVNPKWRDVHFSEIGELCVEINYEIAFPLKVAELRATIRKTIFWQQIHLRWTNLKHFILSSLVAYD